jgi:hypothetical protein
VDGLRAAASYGSTCVTVVGARSTDRTTLGIGKIGVAKLVEGHRGVGSTRDAPQWRSDGGAKLGFHTLEIVQIHG